MKRDWYHEWSIPPGERLRSLEDYKRRWWARRAANWVIKIAKEQEMICDHKCNWQTFSLEGPAIFVGDPDEESIVNEVWQCLNCGLVEIVEDGGSPQRPFSYAKEQEDAGLRKM